MPRITHYRFPFYRHYRPITRYDVRLVVGLIIAAAMIVSALWP
jgi:hypothetical protein